MHAVSTCSLDGAWGIRCIRCGPFVPIRAHLCVQASVVREDVSTPWGFGVATEWLGVGQGHASVISTIAEGSPADGVLKVHDIFVQIDGHLVEDAALDDVRIILLYKPCTFDSGSLGEKEKNPLPALSHPPYDFHKPYAIAMSPAVTILIGS